MADLTTLKALRARVAEATGPDRDLDADVCVALQYAPNDPEYLAGATQIWRTRAHPEGWLSVELQYGTVNCVPCKAPALTASVDAAHRLADRSLRKPFLIDLNWAHQLTEDPIRTEVDAVLTIDGTHVTKVYSEGFDGSSAVARAILAATLDALIAQTEEAR